MESGSRDKLDELIPLIPHGLPQVQQHLSAPLFENKWYYLFCLDSFNIWSK